MSIFADRLKQSLAHNIIFQVDTSCLPSLLTLITLLILLLLHLSRGPQINLPSNLDDSDDSEIRCQVMITSDSIISNWFVDFDGNIMLGDTYHILLDARGCGDERGSMLQFTRASSLSEMLPSKCGKSKYSTWRRFRSEKERFEMDPDFQDFASRAISPSTSFRSASSPSFLVFSTNSLANQLDISILSPMMLTSQKTAVSGKSFGRTTLLSDTIE